MSELEWAQLQPDTLVCVTWEDTTNVAVWLEPGDILKWAEEDPGICRNVGWVTAVGDDFLCVSGRRSLNLNPLQYGLTERIPRGAVRQVSTLGEVNWTHGHQEEPVRQQEGTSVHQGQ